MKARNEKASAEVLPPSKKSVFPIKLLARDWPREAAQQIKFDAIA